MGILQKFNGEIVHGKYGFNSGAEMSSTTGNNIKTSSDLVCDGDFSAVGGVFSSAVNVGPVSTTSTSGAAGLIGYSTSGKICWWSTASACYVPVAS